MKLTIIVAPYDSGHYRSGIGSGPDAILDSGLVSALQSAGHDATLHDIGKVGDVQGREIATGFAVCSAVATSVRAACDEGRFPIVLSGNCLTAAGAVAGEAADSLVWFDQHGDLNTPETSPYGFLDGMALAVTLGLCWRPMAGRIPGFQAIDPSRCMLVDARDLDPDEKTLLAGLPVIHTTCHEAPGKVSRLLAAGAHRTHLHLDLDIHDPAKLRVNRYATPGGPAPDGVRETVRTLAQSLPLSGITISAYDPTCDPEARVPAAVSRLLTEFVAGLEAHA
jgi:arginase